jgi:succinate-semialdehyde dehydrogenase/glutarate-semialdehyde dehydrogenase
MSLQSLNPATGEVFAEYDELEESALDRKIQAAADAFTRHRATSFEERAQKMRRAAELLRERSGRYAELMTREMGKPIKAAVSEVEKCAWVCDYYAEHAGSFLADRPVETDARSSSVKFQPLGPVLAVMPWNFPFWQCFRFLAPALMAGNVGLLKHASNVPGSALAIEEVIRDAGFDEGIFQTLLIGSKVVARVIDDPRVAAVTLTGSEGAGRSVGERAGHAIKKMVLELGGSDPFIVMPSADLERAASVGVTARTINNGQSCIAAKRFIVHESIADEYIERFVEGFRALSVGDPIDEATQIGPLARGEFVDDLERQVSESVARGARVAFGGKRIDRAGFFYEPTVLVDVAPGMPAYEEEIFGPVAAVIRVKDVDEAIAVANATRFGLGSAAWTNDPEEQRRFIDGIEAGCVFINEMVKSDPRVPFGGVKASGVGRELGEFGIREFVNIKTIWIA